ncbi:hypothetical protein CEP54_005864 [Fusarium duplospermum]|uniref:Uncharacterized protein n=1 Tax=Fusarium duplospermum TaxID=1325734 RepID=A0A428QA96_9HYPO|nr:hypothetical protein CEP54_005864 [Fusarium duplospermum]
MKVGKNAIMGARVAGLCAMYHRCYQNPPDCSAPQRVVAVKVRLTPHQPALLYLSFPSPSLTTWNEEKISVVHNVQTPELVLAPFLVAP